MSDPTNSFSVLVHNVLDYMTDTLVVAEERRKLIDAVPETDLVASIASGIVMGTSALWILFYAYQFFMDKCDWEMPYVQILTFARYSLSTFIEVEVLYVLLGDGVLLPLGRNLLWLTTWPVILIEYTQIVTSYGPELNYHDLNLSIVKLLTMLAFCIQASAAKETGKKWPLFAVGFILALWFLYQLQKGYRQRIAFFPDESQRFITFLTFLIIGTWSLWPIFFVIGYPGLNLVSYNTDIVMSVFIDLLTATGICFFSWYTRWCVLEPLLRKENRTSRKITPSDNYVRKKRKLARPDSSIRVVVIENNVAFQRLIQYLMLDAGVDVAVTASINDASEILMRGHHQDFDAVLIDLGYLSVKVDEIKEFRERFSRYPMHIPVLGYTFQDIGIGVKFQEQMKDLCDHVLLRPLDEFKVTETIAHWKKAASLWKELAETSNYEPAEYKPPAVPHLQQPTLQQQNPESPRPLRSSDSRTYEIPTSPSRGSPGVQPSSPKPRTFSDLQRETEMEAEQRREANDDHLSLSPREHVSHFFNSFGSS